MRLTTLSQRGSTVMSWSRNIIYYVITVVDSKKITNSDIVKIKVHIESNIFFSFTENNLAKSRFTRKKLAISHFTGKKRADHASRKHPLLPSREAQNTNSPARALTRTTHCGGERTNHAATAPPTSLIVHFPNTAHKRSKNLLSQVAQGCGHLKNKSSV